jgi:septal ring-binding cell division protein DamX
MTTFTIENESNNITLHATAEEAETVAKAECFSTSDELIALAANWPAARLIEIWNSIPGNLPVKKFTDRKTALSRIWKAIQSLGESASEPSPEPEVTSELVSTSGEAEAAEANVSEQAPDVAPADEEPTKKATRAKKTPTGEPQAAKRTREGSKTATVVDLMKRAGGVTLKAIMEATGWQAHSVRGFISGTLTKKMGLAVVSTKPENGERTYTIAS